MATTGKIDGKNLLVYVNGIAITHSDSCSLSLNLGTLNVTTKDSSNWDDIMPGSRNWTVDCSGMVALDATYGPDELTTLILNSTSVSLKFSTNTSGDKYWTGSAYLTSLKFDAPLNSPATYSATFNGDGALTNPSKT
jgi:predicted secreted protein